MKSSPMCYPFDGRCRCSQDADLSLTFDDADQPLRAHSCLLKMTSPVLKRALEECNVENGSIHLGNDDKQAWIVMLNMVHPLSSQTLDRTDLLGPLKTSETVAKLAMKYGAEFILVQLDAVLHEKLKRNESRYRAVSWERRLPRLPSPPHFPAYYPTPALPSHAYVPPALYPAPTQRGPFYGISCITSYGLDPFAAANTSVALTPSYRYMPETARFSDACASHSPEALDVCTDLISAVDHAARFNLAKSWNTSVEYLVKLLRSESERTLPGLPSSKKMGALGLQVKSMLQRLKDDGYEHEALNFAMEFFDTF